MVRSCSFGKLTFKQKVVFIKILVLLFKHGQLIVEKIIKASYEFKAAFNIEILFRNLGQFCIIEILIANEVFAGPPS